MCSDVVRFFIMQPHAPAENQSKSMRSAPALPMVIARRIPKNVGAAASDATDGYGTAPHYLPKSMQGSDSTQATGDCVAP